MIAYHYSRVCYLKSITIEIHAHWIACGTALWTGSEYVKFSASCYSPSIWSNSSELNRISGVVQQTFWFDLLEQNYMKTFPIRMLVDTPIIVVLGDFKRVLLKITKWKRVCIIAPLAKEAINHTNESLTVLQFFVLLNLWLPFVSTTLDNRGSGKSTLSGSQKTGTKYYFHSIFLQLECICITRTSKGSIAFDGR